MFDPKLPRVLRDALIDPLAEFSLPRDAVESGHLPAKFHALHHPRSVLCRLRRGLARRGATLFFGHAFLPVRERPQFEDTAKRAEFLGPACNASDSSNLVPRLRE